ncbi:MAG: PaaX family transcriptional regulator C-terminal domain-containing protein [Leucothrix sp.]
MKQTPQATTTFANAATTLIERFAQSRPMHANSLLISIYGDTICPHGGTIWLGSLIKLVEPLGINQRLVRTSVFRLAEKNILQSKQVGRRSYYSLTDRAFRQFVSASRRIYAPQAQPWDTQWRLVLTSLGTLTAAQRDTVRKELFWLGFSRLSSGVYVHPMADPNEVQQLMTELGVSSDVAVLTASAANIDQMPMTNTLISECFDLSQSEHEYQRLIADFQAVHGAALKTDAPDPKQCFLVRTLLIHRFRHILLKEPELPDAVIAKDSVSAQARALLNSLYLRLCPAADAYFTDVCEAEGQTLQPPEADYYQRFTLGF